MTHHADQRKTIFWALIIILFGVLLLLNNLNHIDLGDLLRDYWPVILIIVGISMILKREHHHFDQRITGDKQFSTDSSTVEQSNVFGDLKVKINSKNFESGKLNTTFGDIVIDLENLDVSTGEKLLDIHGVFGDIKISLAKELPVLIRASVTAGDIKIFDQKVDGFSKELNYKSNNYESADKKLKIIISHVFGDIKVW